MKSEFCLNFYVLQSQSCNKSTLSKDPISAIQQNGVFLFFKLLARHKKIWLRMCDIKFEWNKIENMFALKFDTWQKKFNVYISN